MKTLALLTLSAWLAMSSATAFAHGNENHASKAPLVKEQKAWGIAGDSDKAQRTITLRMTDDMRFTPNHFSVKQGETVRLRVENKGQIMHEVVLGTTESLQEHADLMLKFPEMEHAEPYMAHVAPAKHEDLVWTFNRAGSFDFACLIAGHFQAGMRGSFTVTQ